ncbi:methyltransferase domain-containing protein [Nonomuraea sp. MCN248]|uniref:Methyltransferase domain-containing protein n=1 Tax=Nonomuraea corallina TaxID=2989783 RepID=A0ABT4SKW7_9ACTN|nr:methyltransferase domain-containing protein [Nonomuraea corallina]MDA0637759.1 methyltransferase domain-containing protein [Nonomuraea corallina]
MSLRFHEIAEARHRILNPITDAKLDLLGEICRIERGMRQLDLACGKGEMLSRWAARYGHEGVGVDISKEFLEAAKERARELEVADQVQFVESDAGAYETEPDTYDIVSCIGATWIGGGLAGTLDLMRRPLRPDGIVLVGECFWTQTPPPEAVRTFSPQEDTFTSLAGTGERFEQAGFELLEMVLASPDSWDRYVASQWWTVSDWLRAHPADPDANAMREFLSTARRSHLEYGRRYLGWGVFVLRQTQTS